MRSSADQLLALAYVYKTGSLTHAARRLGKTQPAISNQLKILGEIAGEPLLLRRRYGVELTPAGNALLPAALAIAQSLEIADEIVGQLRGLEQGVLRVRTSTSVAIYCLPRVLALFHERYPAIEIQMQQSHPREAIDELAKGVADLAILRGPLEAPAHFRTSVIFKDRTLLAVRPDHRYATRTKLRVKDLDGLEIVSRDLASPTRKIIDALVRAAGIKLQLKLEVSSVEAVKEGVLQGFGGGFASQVAIAREIAAGTLVGIEVEDASLSREIFLTYPAAAERSPRIGAFLEALKEIFGERLAAPVATDTPRRAKQASGRKRESASRPPR